MIHEVSNHDTSNFRIGMTSCGAYVPVYRRIGLTRQAGGCTGRNVLKSTREKRPHMRAGTTLNDIHAKINSTRVATVVDVTSPEDVVEGLDRARRENLPVSIAGGRHAMGGQQFCTDAVHLNMQPLNRTIALDRRRGTITVEAGIEWPSLLRDCQDLQRGAANAWGIVQKQTGADRLSIGGAISANIHGRCLTARPFVQDVVSFDLVTASGEILSCSRETNRDLFELVVGGYGLFGVIVAATLRLARRQKVERVVTLPTIDELMASFDDRIREGYLYGDFQFAIDRNSPGFLREGVFSCYRPVAPATEIPEGQLRLSQEDWSRLLLLAHVDKAEAFDRYREYYLASSGQIYWSDTHQSGFYVDDYHEAIDRHLHLPHSASEIITELYVPRAHLGAFMDDVRADLASHEADLIYGTIRLIERDDVTFLNWARDDFACVIFNLHAEHGKADLDRVARQFRRLIDIAIRHDGSFYLTYHRFATRDQVLACYPQFPRFLELKKQHDPQGRFQSEWYRHHASLFA